ncbi:hypothetical protein [Streptomyces cellostaticus]|uniref:hypothetical protein n=1 Tax=Streptomyces cellostaticus TaxID=67285 RepID=UPI002025C3D2|nr:hypothetical protein [Streptomyces cellostaticus]
MSTELLAPDDITVNALQAPGKGLLPARPAPGRGSADAVRSERNLAYAGAVKVPADGHGERIQDGFLIPHKELGWYGRLLARTGAAGRLAFAGAGTEIAQYLTDKQGHKHYKQQTFAGSSGVRDARHRIGPTVYVGTDQVFRLNRIRVEAFSGMAEELYDLLVKGQVEAYRNRTYELRDTYPTSTTAPLWGPVSFGDDGTVTALRVLPTQDAEETS